MDYPTREQAQMLADEKCPEAAKYICQGCELEMWCAPGDDDNGIEISIECGKSFVAMHDAIDEKSKCIERISDTNDALCLDVLDARQERDKAKDMIRRILKKLPCYGTDDFDNTYEEAVAMTKEG